MVAAGRSLMSSLSSFLAFSRLPSEPCLVSFSERESLPEGLSELDRGEAHVEEAGSMSLWHATLYSNDYLAAQVY